MTQGSDVTWLRRGADGDGAEAVVSLDVLVQPRASRAKVGPVHGDRLKLAVTAPPVDGEANAAVIELVAAALGVARSAVTVTAGASSRRKTIRVRGLSAEAVQARLSR
jgi:uncharacterized protein